MTRTDIDAIDGLSWPDRALLASAIEELQQQVQRTADAPLRSEGSR